MRTLADRAYGHPSVKGASNGQTAATPPTDQAAAVDPHDPVDRGSEGFLEDGLVWLMVLLALATGIVGFRFNWYKGGVDVGAKVKVGDELATLVAVTLYSIVGILLFKIGASKTNVPGLQKVAAAI